ncbi:transglutaminase domain-containing protein [Treponema phagedenis]|uniref:Transglutaminase-like domain-containing protein n=1 Tax=Treponema phagedenis TaxID=162 RepID=A0AAE6IRW0_TREPH|nr:transglutaminase domain-containing protein [Treponema phagedenis]QEJ97222.1 hypothetical protein FUT82_03950 [Treponema phagedenis]QSH94294.1 hypothetical protein C5O78_04415 [Treponema phagedenis]
MSSNFSRLFRKSPLFRFFMLIFTLAVIGGGFSFFISLIKKKPVITEIKPELFTRGQEITIYGEHFGEPSDFTWIKIGDQKLASATCRQWNNSSISFTVPEASHEKLLSVHVNGKSSNLKFLADTDMLPAYHHKKNVFLQPQIESSNTDAAEIGKIISLYGKNFGTARNGALVVFTAANEILNKTVKLSDHPSINGAICSPVNFDYDYWSDRELRIRVPDGASSGNIFIITDQGTSNPYPFKLKNRVGSKIYTDKRSYQVVEEIEISNIVASKPNTFFIRMPIPPITGVQNNISILSIKPKPFVENFQDSTLHRFSDLEEGTNIRIRQEYMLDRYKVETKINPAAVRINAKMNEPLYAAYTASDTFIPANDEVIQKQSQSIVKNERNPYLKAKKIYTFLLNNIKPKQGNPEDAGKPIIAALESKLADAYDMSLLFCALTRAAGIPSVPTAGIVIDSNKNTYLHWWAEFYLEGFGWIPVDLGLACNMPFDSGVQDKKNWYFGNIDAFHIAFSRGIQRQTPMILNGRIVSGKRSYALRTIWEETTPSISAYTSLWRTPKVIAVY